MRRRQQDTHRRAVACRQHTRPVDRSGVHHRQDVGHRLFQRRHFAGRQWIGEAEAAGVEHHEPAEGRESPKEPAHERVLPLSVQVEPPLGRKDDVDRAVTDDLIGDVDAVGRLDVPGLGDRAHSPNTPHGGLPRARLGEQYGAERGQPTAKAP